MGNFFRCFGNFVGTRDVCITGDEQFFGLLFSTLKLFETEASFIEQTEDVLLVRGRRDCVFIKQNFHFAVQTPSVGLCFFTNLPPFVTLPLQHVFATMLWGEGALRCTLRSREELRHKRRSFVPASVRATPHGGHRRFKGVSNTHE